MTDGIGGTGGPASPTGPCGELYGVGKSTLLNGTTQYLIKNSPSGVSNATGGWYIGAWVMFIGSVPNSGRSVVVAKAAMVTFTDDTEYALYWNGAGGAWNLSRCSAVDVGTTVTALATPAVDTWYFVEGWWDGSTVIGIAVDRSGGTLAVAGNNKTTANPITVGANASGGNKWPGRIDAAFYGNINPTGVAGLQDALYNAGSGVTFSALSGTDQARFKSWWELGEVDAATLACDFATSANHLTRTGGPTQAVGKT